MARKIQDITDLRSQSLFGNFDTPKLMGEEYDPYEDLLNPTKKKKKDPFSELLKVPPLRISPTESSSGKPEEEDMFEKVRRHFNPETRSTERFDRFIDEAPQMGEPNLMSKLAAGGAYLGNVRRHIPGGQEAAEKTLHAPYYREMADWKAKAEPTYQAANLERQSNIQDRTLATNVITAKAQSDKIASQERIAADKNKIAEEWNRIRRLKAEMGSGWRMVARGTTIKLLNQTTGEVKDTGISTGWMTEADKIEAEGGYRVEAAKALGESRENIVERQQHPDLTIGGKLHTWDTDLQTYVEKMPGPEGAAVNRIGIPSRSGSTQTAAEDRRERNARYQALADANPSLVTDGILLPNLTVNGDWQMGPVPEERWFGRGRDPEKMRRYNEARKSLGLPLLGQEQSTEPAVPAPKPPVGDQTIGGNNRPPPNAIPTPQRQGGSGRSMPTAAYPVGPEEPVRRVSPNQQGGSGRSMPPQVRPQAQSQGQAPIEQGYTLMNGPDGLFQLRSSQVDAFLADPKNAGKYQRAR